MRRRWDGAGSSSIWRLRKAKRLTVMGKLPLVIAGVVQQIKLADPAREVVEIDRAILPLRHGPSWPSKGSKFSRTQVARVQAPANATPAMTIAQIAARSVA